MNQRVLQPGNRLANQRHHQQAADNGTQYRQHHDGHQPLHRLRQTDIALEQQDGITDQKSAQHPADKTGMNFSADEADNQARRESRTVSNGVRNRRTNQRYD